MANVCRRICSGLGQRLALNPSSRNFASSPVCFDNKEHIYTSEHDELRATLRKIIDKDINPYVDEWEAEGIFPAHKVFKTLGNAGILGVSKPTEYGGLGLDYSYSCAMGEELGTINCGALPMAIGVQSDMATPALARFGSDKLKKEYLAPSISGDLVACLGVSEVSSGSDVASLKTTAVKKNGDLIINGGKMWTTNGTQADWMCLLANTSEGKPHQNKSLICLPMNLPALVPLDTLIKLTADYARDRKAFGQSILDNQVVHFTLAELATEVESLRSMLYRAVGQYIQGHDVTMLASMCKLKAGRLSRQTTDKCLQFWGGMGFTNEVLVSRLYRDFRLLSIGGGADEVMLSIICKYMDILPKPQKKK